MKNFFIGIIVAVILFGIFILSYKLNNKIPKPEGCEEIDESCIDCSNPLCRNKVNKKENEKK